MNKSVFLFLVISLKTLCSSAQNVSQYSFTTSEADRNEYYFYKKIALSTSEIPKVKIHDEEFENTKLSLNDSTIQSAHELKYKVGLERKRPFLLIQIPAFRKNELGQIERLKSYKLDIEEPQPNEVSSTKSFAKGTSTKNSVLANGTWQKIAVSTKGIYKIDYQFVKNTLGISGNISSASIRLFGNGGTMLSEDNRVKRPDDLEENALDMYDGGDGLFGEGDYFLFYANGPLDWVKDSINQQFHHRTNLYSNLSYYFITFNNGSGLRMANAPTLSSPTVSVNSYNEYALHEKDLVNLGLFGKTWWGETMGFNSGLTNSLELNFPLNNINDTINFSYQLASAAIGSSNAASFTVQLNNQTIGTHTNIYGITGVDGEDPGVKISNQNFAAIPSFGNLKFNITYNKFVANAKAYLDFIEVNVRRGLVKNDGQQLLFRDWRSVSAGAKAQYTLNNAGSNLKLYDVSNPLQPIKINGTLSGSSYSFIQEASTLHEFAAADEKDYLTPQFVSAVANQNLHGLAQADYIILSHPEMIDAANKLADFHRTSNKYSVVVASIYDVYNEFGSGSADISALRDFVKMFYDRAGSDPAQMPMYLLLLGQASYDYRDIIPNTAKLVPTYETPESLSANNGYCSDDFYAILDSNENISSGTSLLDIGVGRIPATNATQAMAVVDKIIRYKSNEALGAWRINNLFLGDNEDNAGNHLEDADQMFKTIEATTDIYTAQKVYLDNMKIISTPGGARCPDANKVINDNIFKGTFLMNYSGHGSIYTLAHERIITQDDYNSWVNPYKMPIMITATCDFSRFDNPALQSAGEKIMLKNDGGAIALVTTTQVVYATYNRIFNVSYLHTQFTKNAHGWNSFGDAFRISKNVVLASGDITNSRKFALLGDPGLVPNFPRYDVQTDSVLELIGEESTVSVDSVKSLGRYRFYGSVRNDEGNVMNDFKGKVNITFYDKAQTLSIKTANTANRNYNTQNNIIYKGTASVNNGMFEFEFITPKDINYDFGKGKISYYAQNGQIDAAGADTTITVGGFSENALEDNDAPIVRPFMNDSLFKNGGLTGTNSILFAIITDKSGINVSGNFVGHDLVAILDEVVEVPYVLNDYYETAPNTYQRGYVNFPMTGLTDGIHTLRVKAWDVYNNSGENTITFEVLNGNIVKLRNISTYPNPFRDVTHFVFEHNHPNEALKATINIFSSSGALVRTIEQNFIPTGSNTSEITWDGTGNGGEKLFPGVYPFRIRIATEKNIEDLGYQKVVLIR